MLTRRGLLALFPSVITGLHLPLAAFAAQARLFSHKPKVHPAVPQPFVFIGTDANPAGRKGIYVARFDSSTGQLSSPTLVFPEIRSSFFALHPVRDRHLLYAVNESDDEPTSSISTFHVDPQTGALRESGKVSSGGSGPCYLSVDASGRAAFVANYGGSSVASFRIQPDGTLSQLVHRIDFRDVKIFGHQGPLAERQNASHPHSATLSPDNRFLIVNDLGNDAIVVLPIDVDSARFGTPHVIASRVPGAGPRHLAFHPNGRWAYGVDELSSKIDQYLWNTTHGSKGAEAEALLTDTAHTVSTVDPGFHGPNTAAEIVVDPSGTIVYVSNRGEDSLVAFTIDPITGALSPLQRISCGGKKPRHFTLDPTGKWLLCSNQDSASVTIFARNQGNGRLTGPVQALKLESPMFTLFA